MSRDGKNGCYHFARNFHPRCTVGAVACSSRVEKGEKRKMAQPVVSRCLIGVARLSLAVLLVPRPFRCIPPRFETRFFARTRYVRAYHFSRFSRGFHPRPEISPVFETLPTIDSSSHSSDSGTLA